MTDSTEDASVEIASEFSRLGAVAPLSAALAARGYQAPTPVQAAVLEAPPRDLLVSAQTGSGKTVAFGLVIGRALLGDEPRVSPASAPRALIITPTRELAAQVQRELAWLFAGAGARVAAFTGGTDLRGDAKVLARGVDVAVGTPGRLVDLIERKSLKLSSVATLVLDEADEMLDMGFREAIETLLGAAPAERRILLFSATLPTEIRSLAKKYQRDALAVDVRDTSRKSAGAHEDISYVAHLCHNGERTKALVNLLRLADDERALVFCRTREGVADLHRALLSHGFLAAAISGDRAQSERDRALETMRQGRVRILVATDVAARGLDLPELTLVVHMHLPENVEALTHRSGRTGRAGRKGRSVFLVENSERRRAERLFANARLPISFSQAPGLEEVRQREHTRLRHKLLAAAAEKLDPEVTAFSDELLAESEPRAVIGALLAQVLRDRPAGEALTPVELSSPKRGAPVSSGPGRNGDFAAFQINLGARDQATANWILPLLCRRGGVTRREIGAIRVFPDHTIFEVASSAASEFAASAAEPDPRAPHVRVTLADPAARNAAPPPRTSGAAFRAGVKPNSSTFAGDKPRPFTGKPRPFTGDKPRPFTGDKPRAFTGDKPRAFDRPKSFDRPKAFDRPRVEGGAPKPHGDRPKPFDRSKSFGGKPKPHHGAVKPRRDS